MNGKIEKEVVEFYPSSVATGKQHPCQATNWHEMRDFWENDIKSVDPTPILNATDLASQISLTYMSYKTNEFSKTQAQRFFGISRFYDYQLTSPVSPELLEQIDNKETLNWGYVGVNELNFELPVIGQIRMWLPSSFCFPAIPGVNETKIKGYGKKIPIGDIRTREILSAEPVFFEQQDWKLYKAGFDAMYEDVFDTGINREYYDLNQLTQDKSEILIAWRKGTNYTKFYNLVWACLTGHAGDEGYMPGCLSADYDKEYYHINTIHDLNDRFLQFKHYCFYKALNEQQELFNSQPTYDQEQFWREWTLENELYSDWLGIEVSPVDGKGWWMYCKDDCTDGLLEPLTRAPCVDWIIKTWNHVGSDPAHPLELEDAKKSEKIDDDVVAEAKQIQEK